MQTQDPFWMDLAIDLALRGQGRAEPNPLVGCVLVRHGQELARGWHARFGGPHAEADALGKVPDARGATAYVNLEPCNHHGKTPPCTEALIAAGVERVVVGMLDPNPQVHGQGIKRLIDAGIRVDVGVSQAAAAALNAPYCKRLKTGRPWVIAKWAMTLDGRIATPRGESRWISGKESREVVHRLRGRVDAVVVGRNTALADDPLLTARPAGPRRALRVVFDSRLEIPPTSRLIRTAHESPVLIVAAPRAESEPRGSFLEAAGAELFFPAARDRTEVVAATLDELGRRGATNILVEGGGGLLGAFFDLGEIDEVWAFVAPKLLGSRQAIAPLAGVGIERMAAAATLDPLKITRYGDDVCIAGRVVRGAE